ncbi:MAG: GNAT family N-acetyltransferase [Bacteroidales bacterium]
MIERLLWDSAFFDMPVGRAFLSDCNSDGVAVVLDEAKTVGFKLVYLFSETELLGLESDLFDGKVVFSYDLSVKDACLELCEEVNEACEELYLLAFRSGEHSRFLADKRIGEGNFRRMYSLWVDNSVSGAFADKVFVYKIDGKIVGFVTLSLNGLSADIGLIAVDAVYGGRGIGTKLIESCKRAAFDRGATVLNVATQNDNMQACSFYSKNGFIRSKVTYIYHLWF